MCLGGAKCALEDAHRVLGRHDVCLGGRPLCAWEAPNVCLGGTMCAWEDAHCVLGRTPTMCFGGTICVLGRICPHATHILC